MNRYTSGAVVFVDDVERMAAFYAGVFALTVSHTEPGLAVLDGVATQIVIHAIPGGSGEPETDGPRPAREDTPIKLFFDVPSIAKARAQAAALGGKLAPPDREWEWAGRGFRACDGVDPEGNVVQCRERLD